MMVAKPVKKLDLDIEVRNAELKISDLYYELSLVDDEQGYLEISRAMDLAFDQLRNAKKRRGIHACLRALHGKRDLPETEVPMHEPWQY